MCKLHWNYIVGTTPIHSQNSQPHAGGEQSEVQRKRMELVVKRRQSIIESYFLRQHLSELSCDQDLLDKTQRRSRDSQDEAGSFIKPGVAAFSRSTVVSPTYKRMSVNPATPSFSVAEVEFFRGRTTDPGFFPPGTTHP